MAAAASPAGGLSAFRTWAIAQAEGWRAARLTVGRGTWYRHLGILKKLGLPVPYGRQNTTRSVDFVDGTGWFDVSDPLEVMARVSHDPALLLTLPGQSVRVVKIWDACYPVGTTGKVESIYFHENRWDVLVAMDGIPGGWEDLTLDNFFRCTAPRKGGRT